MTILNNYVTKYRFWTGVCVYIYQGYSHCAAWEIPDVCMYCVGIMVTEIQHLV